MTVIRCDACGKDIIQDYYYTCKLNYTESSWVLVNSDNKDFYDICTDCFKFLMTRPKVD